MRVNYYRTRQEKQNKKGHSIIKFFSNAHHPDQLNLLIYLNERLPVVENNANLQFHVIGRRESFVWLEMVHNGPK